jgi:hypothetical protein
MALFWSPVFGYEGGLRAEDGSRFAKWRLGLLDIAVPVGRCIDEAGKVVGVGLKAVACGLELAGARCCGVGGMEKRN